MKTKISDNQRGKQNFGWLQTNYTFSFADYYNPQMMGFRSLRVINEDYIHPNKGFGMHPHHNMEIITYIVEGAIEHQDNMGNKEIIHTDEIQQMSAGTGVYHSEYNPSPSQMLHLLQIWIMPNKKGVTPKYEKKKIIRQQAQNDLTLLISSDDSENALMIHQDAKIYSGIMQADTQYQQSLQSTRGYWLQLIKGSIKIENAVLTKGDAMAIENENMLQIQMIENSEFLFFDLA